jgi:hypothetical protein
MPFCDEDGDGSVSFKECCRAMGKVYLLLVCGVFLLLGGLQLYVATLTSIAAPPGIATFTIHLTYGIGASLIAITLIGIIGVFKMSKLWLGVFSTLMIVLALGMILLGGYITSWMGQIESIEKTTNNLASSDDSWLNNYLNCTYLGCCTACPSKSSSNNGASIDKLGSEFCRKMSVPCLKDAANIHPTFCAGIQQTNVNEKCQSPPLYRGGVLGFVRKEFLNVVITLLASVGIIASSLVLSCYFTISKKVVHVMDQLDDHHHAYGPSQQA